MILEQESRAFPCHNRLVSVATALLLQAMLVVLAPQTTAASQGDALVQAFVEGCLPRELNFAQSNNRALELGWHETPEDNNPELAAVIDKAKWKRESPGREGWKYQVSILKKQITGREIYLVKKRIVFSDSGPRLKCFVYDFAATQPTSPGGLNRLLGQKFTESSLDKTSKDYNNPRLIVSYQWEQPDREIIAQLLFISQLSPLIILTGYNGLMIAMSMPEYRAKLSK